jgi:DNA-binding FadR family transcriptional regulator
MAWQQDGSPSVAFLQKLTEVRLIVEPAAAERAAQRATAADLQTIEEAYRDMAASLEGEADFEAFDRADRRFHQAIVRACGNDLLERMSHVVVSALLVSFHATSRLPGRAKASLPQHRAILEAIRGRQARVAGQAMRSLVVRTAREVERLAKRTRR